MKMKHLIRYRRKNHHEKEFKKTIGLVCRVSMNHRDINLYYLGSFISSLSSTINFIFTNILISDYLEH